MVLVKCWLDTVPDTLQVSQILIYLSWSPKKRVSITFTHEAQRFVGVRPGILSTRPQYPVLLTMRPQSWSNSTWTIFSSEVGRMMAGQLVKGKKKKVLRAKRWRWDHPLRLVKYNNDGESSYKLLMYAYSLQEKEIKIIYGFYNPED